jgi:hydrogenase small subunit
MPLTRREFLETAGVGTISVLGITLFKFPGLAQVAKEVQAQKVAEVPVIWMALGSCSGCSVSLLNTASPTIQEALLAEVLPGKHLSLAFHSTVMAAQGDLAMETMEKVRREQKGQYALVIEGAPAAKDDGLYCAVGETADGPITGYQHVRDLGRDAAAALAVGSCAAFGGIPSATPDPTGALSVQKVLEQENISTPVVNIPGCPPHPDWIVGSIAAFLLGGVAALKLDEHNRPGMFFSRLIHDNCLYRGDFDRGVFAEHFGDEGCLFMLGCKGPITEADCPVRKFNGGTSWCCEAGHPCIGCCHPDFPFEGSMFRRLQHSTLSRQVLDENHVGHSCTACHADNGFYRAPTCEECHEPEEGISFPAKRPGPILSGGASKK